MQNVERTPPTRGGVVFHFATGVKTSKASVRNPSGMYASNFELITVGVARRRGNFFSILYGHHPYENRK